jgi:predicted DNA-binding transcriptional regulator YafY
VTFERVFGIRSVRRIAPYGLVAKAAIWYVVWVGEDERFRVDRISRILSAELQEECFDRPTDFDLEEFWAGWCERRGRNEPRVKVVLRVSEDALPTLRARLGGAMRAAAVEAHSGSRGHVIEAAFPTMEDARGQLLAFGGAVEVIEPQALRLTLLDFAEQAVYVYRNG